MTSLKSSVLSAKLSGVSKIVDISGVESAVNQAIDNFDATQKSILGSTVGQIENGIQALTDQIDDAQQALETNLTSTISRVTSSVPGLSNKLKGDIGSAASDISKITGTASAAVDGFIHEIISGASPEAVSASLKGSIGATTAEVQNVVKGLTTDILQNTISSALEVLPFQELLGEVTKFKSQLNEIIGTASDKLLDNFGEKITKRFEMEVSGWLDRAIPTAELEQAFNAVSNGDYQGAYNITQKYVDTPDNYDEFVNNFPRSDWPAEVETSFTKKNELQSNFKTLSVNVSSYIDPYSDASLAAGYNSLGYTDVSARMGTKNGVTRSNEQWSFDDIASEEELEAMFRNISRSSGNEVAGAIIHWTGTFLNQDIGSDWVHDAHIQRGFAGCGYHVIIRRDGTLQRGRPMDLEGAHDINNNRTFLGFSFVGGLNEYSNNATKPYWKYASEKSFTREQYVAFEKLMKVFLKVFPYAQVQGHYATSNDGKQDPGFDVPGYMEAKFNHKNVIGDTEQIWKASTAITLDTIKTYGAYA